MIDVSLLLVLFWSPAGYFKRQTLVQVERYVRHAGQCRPPAARSEDFPSWAGESESGCDARARRETQASGDSHAWVEANLILRMALRRWDVLNWRLQKSGKLSEIIIDILKVGKHLWKVNLWIWSSWKQRWNTVAAPFWVLELKKRVKLNTWNYFTRVHMKQKFARNFNVLSTSKIIFKMHFLIVLAVQSGCFRVYWTEDLR